MSAKTVVAAHDFTCDVGGVQYLVHAGERYSVGHPVVKGRESLFGSRALTPGEHRERRRREEAEREAADPMLVFEPRLAHGEEPDRQRPYVWRPVVEIDGQAIEFVLVEGQTRLRRSHPAVQATDPGYGEMEDWFIEADQKPPEVEKR